MRRACDKSSAPKLPSHHLRSYPTHLLRLSLSLPTRATSMLVRSLVFVRKIDAKRNEGRWEREITVVEWVKARERRKRKRQFETGGGEHVQGQFTREAKEVEGLEEGEETQEQEGAGEVAPPRPCHTLDYATSGLLVMAKTDQALAQVSVAFDASRIGPLLSSAPSTISTTGPARYRVAKEYRAKTELRKLAASSVERDVSALRSPSSANRRNEGDEQLTKQVQHLFTEKAMLQRRLKELERENQHLHDEMEMLYTQVDEQADEVDAAYERAMRDAADVVVLLLLVLT